MKKILLLLTFVLTSIGTWAQSATTNADGVYKIYWDWNDRGYLAYHDGEYPNEPQLAGVEYSGCQDKHYAITADGISLSWYLYTSSATGKSYLFEATTGKFITFDPNVGAGSNGKACSLSAEPTEFSQLDLYATTNTDAYKFRFTYNETTYRFCSGCGSDKNQHPVRFATDGQSDGGVPFVFVSEGASIEESVTNAAIAKIKKLEAVAKIGENDYYATLVEAISAATAGQTVTLLADVNASEIIVINKAITLDGNGKKLTSTAGRAINVSGTDDNGVTIQNLTIDAKGERAINVIQGAKKVNITNVTATAKNYAVNAATSAPNTVISISDSELSGLNVVNIAAPGAQITVDGTTLNCNDQSDAEGYAALCLGQEADGASISATDVTFNITCDEATPSHKAKCNVATGSITIGGSEDEVKKAVAVVEYLPGPYYYAFSSLQAAFDKAKEGETVKLVNDVVVDEAVKINKLVTLDFNGFEITPADNLSASVFEVTGELCFKNKVEGSIADGLIYYIINDADYKAETGKTFNLTEDKEGVSIVYKRTFSHDGWQVLYVPFDIPVSLTQDKFEVYSITGISDVVELEQVTNGTLTLNAHTPYIIKVHADKVNEVLHISGAAATTLYKPADEPYTATYGGDYTITGTYTSKAIAAGEEYVLTNGKWCQLTEKAVTDGKNILGAFRVYLTANGENTPSEVRFVINNSDATAIDELKVENGNVKAEVYDLSGRRVEKAEKGIFVVNGKKVVK